MSTPPPATGFTISNMADLCLLILNAATDTTMGTGPGATLGTVDDDTDRHSRNEAKLAIRVAQSDIILAVLSTPNHPDRSKFALVTPGMTGITHRALIPGHIGQVGMVLVAGKAATYKPPEEIERLITNVLGLQNIGPYYAIAGDPPRLFFVTSDTGITTADIIDYADSGDAIQAPPQYIGCIFRRAMTILFSKEGAETATAGMYVSASGQDIDLIKSGATPLGMEANPR